jgi:hypothetical protein
LSSAKNKIIPENAKLYCFFCMDDQPVREGELKDGKLPIFCRVCQNQISELITTPNGWQLYSCFYEKKFPAQIRKYAEELGLEECQKDRSITGEKHE